MKAMVNFFGELATGILTGVMATSSVDREIADVVTILKTSNIHSTYVRANINERMAKIMCQIGEFKMRGVEVSYTTIKKYTALKALVEDINYGTITSKVIVLAKIHQIESAYK